MTTGQPVVWGAVVVAAGQSERFGDTDKLFGDLNGKPVIYWSLAVAASDDRVRQIALVSSDGNAAGMQSLVDRDFALTEIRVCRGGNTRSDSVRSGLRALDPDITHVAIHDGARPLASANLVSRVLDAAERSGAAIPVTPVTSSIGVEMAPGGVLAETLDRTYLRELQTPQAALRRYLDDAICRFPGETDESAALLRAGYRVSIVPGEASNLKVTVPEDLVIAAALARTYEAEI